MRFGAGKKTDLLSPEERAIVDRFERGAIDAAEAGRLLIDSVQRAEAAHDKATSDSSDEAEAVVDPNETPEEAKARELVERIAREVDAERGR
jgi:polyhydroxyalkanoate synthesis regulator phasin